MFKRKKKKKEQAHENMTSGTEDVLRGGISSLQDLLAPSVFAREPDSLLVGNVYNAGLFVSGYPRFVRLGWLSRLFRHPGNLDIAMYINPIDPRKAIETLTRKIAQFTATLNEQTHKGQIPDPEFEAALEDAEELRRKLQFSEESLFELGMYFNLFNTDPKQLQDLMAEVEYLADAAELQTRRAIYRQQENFDSVIPVGTDYIANVRNFTTSALATTFPFVSPQLSATEGMPILLGVTEDRNLVMFDIFSLPSFNSCIIARTGAGKSYLAKLLTLRHLCMGVDIVVIDPKGEYDALAKAIGGQVIKLSLQSKDKINIFEVDLQEGEGDVGDFLSSKIVTIFRFLSMMIGKEMTPRERNILLSAVEKVYEERGITRDPNSLFENEAVTRQDGRVLLVPNRKKKAMPTLGDLARVLQTYGKEGERLAEALQPYTTGVYSGVFNVETNVDLENRFIVFDISDMEEELAQFATFVSLEWLWTRIKRRPKKRLVLIDEAWRLLLQHNESAEYMSMIARTARQFWGGLMVITQQPQDVLGSEHGRAIITNSEVRILLRQDRGNLDALGTLFSLSEEEKNYLARCERGSALVIAGNNHIAVHNIKAFAHEHPLITTDPEELAQLRESLRQKDPTPEANA